MALLWRYYAPMRTNHLHPHIRHKRNARRLGLAFWSNMVFAILWMIMLPVTLESGLKSSVPFVAAISIYALFLGHLTGALAALAGKASSENAEKLHSPDVEPGP